MRCLFSLLCYKGVTLTDLKEAEKTMGRTGDSKAAAEQRSKEDEKRDKDGEQPSQESTVGVWWDGRHGADSSRWPIKLLMIP